MCGLYTVFVSIEDGDKEVQVGHKIVPNPQATKVAQTSVKPECVESVVAGIASAILSARQCGWNAVNALAKLTGTETLRKLRSDRPPRVSTLISVSKDVSFLSHVVLMSLMDAIPDTSSIAMCGCMQRWEGNNTKGQRSKYKWA